MKAMAPDLEHRYQSADAMIADLEAFRKNPEVEMKFDLSDLRPEENDEPTRTIRTMPSHTVTIPVHQPERNYPRRERDEDEEPRRTGSGKRGVLVGAVTVAAVAVVIVLFKTILGSFAPAVVDQYQVPDLYDMTIEEAENDPRIEGVFEIQKAGSEFAPTCSEGHILRQDPKKGETRKGSQLVIQVWVSAGEETGEVPDLENKSEQDARILLEKLNKEYNLELTVEAPEELKQFSEEITEGYVIKTEPAQGEILKKGDTVKLILSKGPDIKPVTVLPFVGMSIDSVLSQLESYKLTCDAADVEVVDSDKPRRHHCLAESGQRRDRARVDDHQVPGQRGTGQQRPAHHGGHSPERKGHCQGGDLCGRRAESPVQRDCLRGGRSREHHPLRHGPENGEGLL